MTLTWRIRLGKVPTRIILDRKMVNLEHYLPIVLIRIETVNHLFLSCDIAFPVSGIHVLGG